MIWSAMQINRGGCQPPRPFAYMILHIIRKAHSIFHYSVKICKFLTTLPPRRLSANHLPLSYSGCHRLFMRGFGFRSSLKKWPARKVFSRGFAARVFGLRPNMYTCRPVADETKLPVAREKKPLVPRVPLSGYGFRIYRSCFILSILLKT